MGCSSCSAGACSCGFGPQDADSYGQTLVSSLICCVDQARAAASCLGARPYRVRLVRTRWTGGERGDGIEEVVSAIDLTPTPLVAGMTGVSRAATPYGTNEDGLTQVSEVSMRYTEDFLTGRGAGGADPERGENFYWEVDLPQPGGGVRRRFVLEGVPTMDPENVQWKVSLRKQNEDRYRSGDPAQ